MFNKFKNNSIYLYVFYKNRKKIIKNNFTLILNIILLLFYIIEHLIKPLLHKTKYGVVIIS